MMATGSKVPPEVINISDDKEEQQEWPETGLVNLAEAK